MILFILCAIVVAVIMSHAPFGVAVRMIGSNEKATRYSGVATDWMLVGVYVVSSLLCWVATVVMMARFNSAVPPVAPQGDRFGRSATPAQSTKRRKTRNKRIIRKDDRQQSGKA